MPMIYGNVGTPGGGGSAGTCEREIDLNLYVNDSAEMIASSNTLTLSNENGELVVDNQI